MTDWMPIETAPKDGTNIIVLIEYGKNIYEPQMMQWYNNDWKMFCGHGNTSSLGVPTYWIPIPKTPTKVVK